METCVQLSILIPNKPFFCWTNNWLSVCCKSVCVNFHALPGASIPEGWVDCVGCVPGIVTSEALSLPVTQMLLISRSLVSNSLQPYGLQHTKLPCSSPSPGVCSNSRPLNWWCHPTISSSAALFFCLQFFPASGSFPVSQFFTSGDQSIGTSASASVLPLNIQGWFPSGLTGLILLSKGFSRIFSSTTVWNHQFFGTKPSL